MKRLYLLRHATALSADSHGDKERKLAQHGLKEAVILGQKLKQKSYIPEYVLCSPALRTRETLAQLSLQAPQEFPEKMYNASPETLLAHVHELDNGLSSALVIAHNPGISYLALMLAGSGPHALLEKIASGFHPCSLAVLECPAESWKDIRVRENTLIDFLEA